MFVTPRWYTQHRVNADTIGQGVLLVSEPHSELNAGFIVVFGSSHPALFCWKDWTRRCRCLPEEKYDDLVSHQADVLAGLFWIRLGEFLQRTLGEHDLTPVEKQYWIHIRSLMENVFPHKNIKTQFHTMTERWGNPPIVVDAARTSYIETTTLVERHRLATIRTSPHSGNTLDTTLDHT